MMFEGNLSWRNAKRKNQVENNSLAARSGRILKLLNEAAELLTDEEYDGAYDVLQKVLRNRPNDIDALQMIGHIYDIWGDRVEAWKIAVKLLEIDRNNPTSWFNSSITMMNNALIFNAKYCLDYLESHWPDAFDTSSMRQPIIELYNRFFEGFEDLADGYDSQPNRDVETAGMYYLSDQDKKAFDLINKAAPLVPNLPLMRNDIAVTYAVMGNYEDAIRVGYQVLDDFPNHIITMASLIDYLILFGRREETPELFERMEEQVKIQELNPMAYTKIMSTYAHLADDDRICNFFDNAEENKTQNSQFHHLAAVSFAKRGDEEKARRLWSEALEFDNYSNEIILDNLQDLSLPKHKRTGPYPFELDRLFHSEWLLKVAKAYRTDPDMRNGRESVQAVCNELPMIEKQLPFLIERGGKDGLGFALDVSACLDNTSYLTDFIFGKHGSDMERKHALNMAVFMGILPNEAHTIFVEDRQQEVEPLYFDITFDPFRLK